MSLRQSTTHVVASFLNADENGKKSVDVVHKSWLRFERNKWICTFPPEKDYQNIDDWLKNNEVPKDDWVTSEISIVKQAR